MNIDPLFDFLGEGGVVTLGGLTIGILFGIFAQRSRFCMRSAVIEFFHGSIGPKMAVWLLVFFAALAGTQGLIATGFLDVSEARQLAARGSLSGAIIGGLMFGSGMIFARGCASRLLVLSANGNLRALLSGLVLTIVAQASLRGGLSPAREALWNIWTVDGGQSRDIMAILGLGGTAPLAIGVVGLAVAVFFLIRNKVSAWISIGAIGVGSMIALGWLFTYFMSYTTFDPVPVKSISFIGPSADTLMGLINQPTLPLGFDLGLVPGVFAGSFIAAFLAREIKFECFNENRPMPRYIFGASLMGFGGMLAGGCAVGAGVTGGAVFALTAWVALTAMWVGGGVTDYLLENRWKAATTRLAKTLLPAE